MATYAALVSLNHILDQILNPPPMNQIIIVREQIESLREKVTFLQKFLENHCSRHNKEIEDLEKLIVDATYEAEDIIESNVIKQIISSRPAILREKSHHLSQDIQTIIEKFDLIEKELVKIKDEKGGVEDQRPKISTTTTSSSRSLPSGKNSTMVGYQEHLIEIMSALATDESKLRIIPIVGMGGIGKTTLATNVYNNPFVVEHFHVRAWITISQEYSVRDLLLGLLNQIPKIPTHPNKQEINENLGTSTDKMSEKGDDQIGELGEMLYKRLSGRKYLIVMDDMWNIEAWNEIKRFLPSNTNGSRILVTTRLFNLAVDLGYCSPYKMEFLNEEQSWDLLCDNVFAQEGCPDELEEIGKCIAKRCGGLPLALVVIGGLLAMSKNTREHWEYVQKHVTSVLNYGNDEHFMKILSLCYDHLPIHLKPCFLYLAVFPEDSHIRVSRLIKLWVAEGFIKSNRSKSLEEVAEEYLKDLIDRNLILVQKRGSSGKIKTCSIHDLLRDLCTKEAHKHKFLRIAKFGSPNIPPYLENERRLVIHYRTKEEKAFKAGLQSMALTRSFVRYFSNWELQFITHRLGLLRVLDVVDDYYAYGIQQLTNLRYVGCYMNWVRNSISSSICRLWNLQTLLIDGYVSLPAEIWQMPQLRHLKIRKGRLCEPPNAHVDGQNIVVLENLQTLSTFKYLRCNEQVIKRIPNLRKLGLNYGSVSTGFEYYYLNNIAHLYKLESLFLKCDKKFFNSIAFPSSLKKLSLSKCKIPWEDMSIVGSLPNLEVLKLYACAAHGLEWNPIEGEFCRLKFLLIDECELDIWGADDTHFPSLERLILGRVSLKEIPKDFAEISTLQVIGMSCSFYWSSNSLWTSAKEISVQREGLGYEGLRLVLFYL